MEKNRLVYYACKSDFPFFFIKRRNCAVHYYKMYYIWGFQLSFSYLSINTCSFNKSLYLNDWISIFNIGQIINTVSWSSFIIPQRDVMYVYCYEQGFIFISLCILVGISSLIILSIYYFENTYTHICRFKTF